MPHHPRLAFAMLLLTAACDDDALRHHDHEDHTQAADAGALPVETHSEPTYWHDIVPIFEQHCLQCHRDGGIAPFRLDEHARAAALSSLISRAVQERRMPPWSVTSDGSCGEFADSAALSDDDIATIARWAQAGAPEGPHGQVKIPALPTLETGTEVVTPKLVPRPEGGTVAEHDEYRCFALDVPVEGQQFITGYDVLPGLPEIVHHVVAFVVDPEAPAESEDGQPTSETNRDRMRALDAESPERDGWTCYGAAGDGVHVDATPIVWAPGQGVVSFPAGTGVPLRAAQRLVVQVHYNLSDPKQLGKADQTRVRLRLVDHVDEVGLFALVDPLLGSLQRGMPTSLPRGMADAQYKWTLSAREIGMQSKHAKLYGIMPHMHGLGRKYDFSLTQPGAAARCAAQVNRWDFHWQRMYFYAAPLPVEPDTLFSVTCHYDTSEAQQDIQPGWGTGNEMCLATLYVGVPWDEYQALAMQ